MHRRSHDVCVIALLPFLMWTLPFQFAPMLRLFVDAVEAASKEQTGERKRDLEDDASGCEVRMRRPIIVIARAYYLLFEDRRR